MTWEVPHHNRAAGPSCGCSRSEPHNSSLRSFTSWARSVGRSGPHQSPSNSPNDASRAAASRAATSWPGSVSSRSRPCRDASPRPSTCRAASMIALSGTDVRSASSAGSTHPYFRIRSTSQLDAGNRSYPARVVMSR